MAGPGRPYAGCSGADPLRRAERVPPRSGMTGYDAVLILSFGGPEGPGDVAAFLGYVTRGRNVATSRVEEMARRYSDLGGMSPINGQCRRMVAALDTELAGHGIDLPVYWGNRNRHPMLTDTVATMATMAPDGVEQALAIVTSAYSSYSGCRQYLEDIQKVRSFVGRSVPRIDKVRAYYDHPGFVGPFADATARALGRLGELGPERTSCSRLTRSPLRWPTDATTGTSSPRRPESWHPGKTRPTSGAWPGRVGRGRRRCRGSSLN